MLLPDYKLVGVPGKFRNGHRKKATCFAQRYRLLAELPRKVRSVSLKTTDLTVARRRVVRYVEDAIRKHLVASNPEARTASRGIAAVLKEYTDDLAARGNSEKQITTVKTRIGSVVNQGKLKEYAQVDAVVVTKAINQLMKQHGFGVVTANRYREAMRAWTRWMKKNGRWPCNVLEDMPKFKGDDSPTRKRAILTDAEFETLLRVTKDGPDRRCLSGEQRYWLYLIASQTGLRAPELNSLKPTSFDLDTEPPAVTVHCTISKRRKTDRILLRRDFAELLRMWLDELDPNRRLWGCSASWYYKAGSMLRADLEAAGINNLRGEAVIDFHSFRAMRVTKAILSGKPSRLVMAAVRLSSESLLDRYSKISTTEINDLVNAVPMPNLLRVVAAG